MYINNKNFKKTGKMNKRGSIIDLFFFVVIVVVLAIFFIIINFVSTSVTNELKETELNQSALALRALNYQSQLTAQFDYVFLIIFIGLIMGILISSFLIHVHKVFLPVYIILFIIAILIGVIMNNVYDKFITNTSLAATSTLHPFANAIINNYVLVLIGVGILSMILIFGKTGGGAERM